MDRETKNTIYKNAKEEVKGHLEEYLLETGRPLNRNFSCPCKENHKHGDRKPSAGFFRRGNKVYCFGCGESFDIFDMIAADNGIPMRSAEAINAGFAKYGNDIKQQISEYEISGVLVKKIKEYHPKTEEKYSIPDLPENEKYDFTKICNHATEVLLHNEAALKHYLDRGLNLETIKKAKLGYIQGGYNEMVSDYPELASKGKKKGLYKYVFPNITSENTVDYMYSEISNRDEMDDYNGKYGKVKGIHTRLYNEHYIEEDKEFIVWIVEGLYDALSIEQVGGNAIGLMGIGQTRLLSLCKKYRPKMHFILCLDDDMAGKKAMKKLKEGLNFLKIPYNIAFPPIGKDMNESLMHDEMLLKEYVDTVEEDILFPHDI